MIMSSIKNFKRIWRQDSWHYIWLDCDRSKTGAVAAYNVANSCCLSPRHSKDQKNESIVRKRVAAAMLGNNDLNVWSEVKRIRGNKAGIIGSIDGLTESDSITKLFAVKYVELYTSVPYYKADMHDIVSSLYTALNDSPIASDLIINFIDVKAAVNWLQPHKREGCSELFPDNIIYATDDCLIHIACLFSAIIIFDLSVLNAVKQPIVYGAVPVSFGMCTIVLIPNTRYYYIR